MNCWNCNKDIPQIEGKKPRKYCDDACRMAYKRAQAKANKTIKRTSPNIKSEHILHPDIIANIRRVCTNENEVDEAKVKIRTTEALRYARMFPDKPQTILPKLHPSTGHIRVPLPGDEDYVCSQQGQRICWRCGKPTPSPLLDTHLDCTVEGRTISSEPHTAPTTDEQATKGTQYAQAVGQGN